MKKTYEFIEEEFDGYLDGDLTAAEKADFEHRLAADPDLQEAFDFHRSVRQTLGGASRRAARKENLARIRGQMLLPASQNRGWLKSLGFILLLALVAGGVWYFGKWNQEAVQPGQPAPTTLPVDTLTKPAATKPSASGPRDTTKPRANSGGKDAGKPTGPVVAQGHDPADFFKQTLRIVHIRPEQPDSAGAAVSLSIHKSNDPNLWCSPPGANLQLYVPAERFDRAARFGLFQLDNTRQSTLYLRVARDFYPVRGGGEPLKKESDESILTLLRRFADD